MLKGFEKNWASQGQAVEREDRENQQPFFRRSVASTLLRSQIPFLNRFSSSQSSNSNSLSQILFLSPFPPPLLGFHSFAGLCV
ncbi:hypothetical protein Csa_019726 [Cucumis sativus]|uniref:Uncharacterized protein n=1 Tax=Cucumis sativus TaxID=3659 RepID=A0A0A0LVC8_CUCSA|nr:hypothetical protein Csa_019726 [Cucumis sativus]